MKLQQPLSADIVNAIGQLFFPHVKEWEIFDAEKLSEKSKWNGLDIVRKGYFVTDLDNEFVCVQISLDEDKSFTESIMVYCDDGDVNLTGSPEMTVLEKLLQ